MALYQENGGGNPPYEPPEPKWSTLWTETKNIGNLAWNFDEILFGNYDKIKLDPGKTEQKWKSGTYEPKNGVGLIVKRQPNGSTKNYYGDQIPTPPNLTNSLVPIQETTKDLANDMLESGYFPYIILAVGLLVMLKLFK